jgi:hypothetical protein
VSDDAQAVVVEVSEAVSAALEEFHFSIETLGDAIVFGEAPHGDEGVFPEVEGAAETHEGLQSALEELLDESQQARDEPAAGAFALAFEAQQIPEFDHFLVDGD